MQCERGRWRVMAVASSPPSESPGQGMMVEASRLTTFRQLKWPDWAPVGSEKLAKAGFFYSGNADEVQCFSCGGRYSGWDFNDQAIVVHRQKYPTCPFIVDQASSGNVPMTGSRSKSVSVARSSTTSLSPPGSIHPIRVPMPPESSDPLPVSTGGARPSSVVFRSERHFRLSRSMTKEEDRLTTFRRWPKNTVVDPYLLARAGFFFTGRGDTVQCAFCRGRDHTQIRLQEWQPGDDPLREHSEHFPDCPFIRGTGDQTDASSVPAVVDTSSSGDQETSRVELIVPATRPTLSPSNSQEKGEAGRKESCGSIRMKEMGIVSHTPAHSHMATYQARLLSFQGWPPERKQRPQDLAQAGFFYAGFSDNVKCFHCNGGLHNWDPNDSPFREHAKWFGVCDYLRLCKGDEYVQAVESGRDVQGQEGGTKVTSTPPEPRTISDLIQHGVSVNVSDEEVQLAKDMGYPEHLIVLAIINNGYRLFGSIGDLLDNMESLRCSRNIQESVDPMDDGEKMESEEMNEPSTSGANGNLCGESIVAENRFLKEQRTCKICMDAEVSVVILPCGHLCCCPTCAPALHHCPICRKDIRGFVRTYFS